MLQNAIRLSLILPMILIFSKIHPAEPELKKTAYEVVPRLKDIDNKIEALYLKFLGGEGLDQNEKTTLNDLFEEKNDLLEAAEYMSGGQKLLEQANTLARVPITLEGQNFKGAWIKLYPKGGGGRLTVGDPHTRQIPFETKKPSVFIVNDFVRIGYQEYDLLLISKDQLIASWTLPAITSHTKITIKKTPAGIGLLFTERNETRSLEANKKP